MRKLAEVVVLSLICGLIGFGFVWVINSFTKSNNDGKPRLEGVVIEDIPAAPPAIAVEDEQSQPPDYAPIIASFEDMVKEFNEFIKLAPQVVAEGTDEEILQYIKSVNEMRQIILDAATQIAIMIQVKFGEEEMKKFVDLMVPVLEKVDWTPIEESGLIEKVEQILNDAEAPAL